MTNSDNKLILVRDSEGKVQLRYRMSEDAHWKTISTNRTDIDKIIEEIRSKFED